MKILKFNTNELFKLKIMLSDINDEKLLQNVKIKRFILKYVI